MDKPDIIDFIEQQFDVELFDWQKEALRKMYDAGPDAKIVFPRHVGYTNYRHLSYITTEIFKEDSK